MVRFTLVLLAALAVVAAASPSWAQEESPEPLAYEPSPCVEEPPAYQPEPYVEEPLAYEPSPYVEAPFEPSLDDISGPAAEPALADRLWNNGNVDVNPEPATAETPDALEQRWTTGQAPLTLDQAHALLNAAGQHAAAAGATPDYYGDACFYRAHLYEEAARAAGYVPERIFYITGRSALPEDVGVNGMPARYHTAIVVPVLGDDGVARRMVIDPSLDPEQPIRMADWNFDPDAKGREQRVYLPDDAGDEPFTRWESVVTVAPGTTEPDAADGTTCNTTHYVPASMRPSTCVDMGPDVKAQADEVYEVAFPGGGLGRFRWQKVPYTGF